MSDIQWGILEHHVVDWGDEYYSDESRMKMMQPDYELLTDYYEEGLEIRRKKEI